MIFLKLSLQLLNLSIWDHLAFVSLVFLGKFSLLLKQTKKPYFGERNSFSSRTEVTIFKGPLVFMVVNSPDSYRRPITFLVPIPCGDFHK